MAQQLRPSGSSTVTHLVYLPSGDNNDKGNNNEAPNSQQPPKKFTSQYLNRTPSNEESVKKASGFFGPGRSTRPVTASGCLQSPSDRPVFVSQNIGASAITVQKSPASFLRDNMKPPGSRGSTSKPGTNGSDFRQELNESRSVLSTVDAARQAYAEMQKFTQAKMDDHTRLTKKLADCETQNTKLLQKMKTALAEKARLETQQNLNQQRINDLDTLVQRHELQVSSIGQYIEDLELKLARALSELSSCREQINSTVQRSKKLQPLVNQALEKEHTLNNIITKERENVKILRQEIAEKQVQMSTLKNENEELRKEQDKFSSINDNEMIECRKQLEKLNAEKEKYESENCRLQQTCADLKKNQTQLELNYNELVHENKDLRTLSNESKMKEESLKAKLNEMETDLQKIEKREREFMASIRNFQFDKKQLEEELQKKQVELDSKIARLNALERENEDLIKNIDAIKKESEGREDLQKEYDAMKSSLAGKNEELNRTKSELEKLSESRAMHISSVSKIQELENVLQHYEQLLSLREQEISGLKTQIERAIQESSSGRRYQTECENLRKQIKELERREKDFLNQISNISNQMKEYNSKNLQERMKMMETNTALEIEKEKTRQLERKLKEKESCLEDALNQNALHINSSSDFRPMSGVTRPQTEREGDQLKLSIMEKQSVVRKRAPALEKPSKRVPKRKNTSKVVEPNWDDWIDGDI